jgi:hypothetical protein
MGTENDPRIQMIDSALYHLQPSTTPYATPFTYNNGLTVLEILERIRTAVIDTIRYANSFGEDVNGMVKKVNESADKWQKDAQKTIDDLVKYDNDSKAYLDVKRAEADKIIADFTATLIKVAFIPKENGDFVEAEMKDGSKLLLPTKQKSDKTDAKALDFYNGINGRLQREYYTRLEADDRYVLDKKISGAIVVGGTNATGDREWLRWVKAWMGYTFMYNYAMEGGGFTSKNSNSFNTQLLTARSKLHQAMLPKVKHILVLDCIYDINERYSIREPIAEFIGTVNQYFPNAKVKILPVLFNTSQINNDINKGRSVWSRIAEMNLQPVDVCEGSMTWYHNLDEVEWKFYNKDGSFNTVELSDNGYIDCAYRFAKWMSGGTSYRLRSSVNLGPLSHEYVHNEYNFLNCTLRSDMVNIQGTFRTGPNKPPADTVLSELPGWAFPYGNTTGLMWGGDRQIYPIYVKPDATLVTGAELPENMTFNVNFTYRIF